MIRRENRKHKSLRVGWISTFGTNGYARVDGRRRIVEPVCRLILEKIGVDRDDDAFSFGMRLALHLRFSLPQPAELTGVFPYPYATGDRPYVDG